MTEVIDPIQWWAGWITVLMQRRAPEALVFGIDGHFQAYAGAFPIDKGWNTKRRLAERGLAAVRVNDGSGQTWSDVAVPAGDRLSDHVLTVASALREGQALTAGDRRARPIVLAFDRGGFAFEVLNALAAEGFGYLTWVGCGSLRAPGSACVAWVLAP